MTSIMNVLKIFTGFVFWISILVSPSGYGQFIKRPLDRSLNIPNSSNNTPSLSADARTMLYLSTYSSTGDLELMISKQIRPDVWTKPEELIGIYKSNLDYERGYWLSQDARQVYISSRRAPGVGLYDIWLVEGSDLNWGIPVNLGKPINSSMNEGSPSISPDGTTMYFMRCQDMDQNHVSGCSLYSSQKRGSSWLEPEKLPLPLNTGHETTPRILADNQTLIFASDRPGGKGGMDLYLSRKEENGWSEPMNLDFLNTEADDDFVSIPAKGDLIFFSAANDRGYDNIFIGGIPEEFRPRDVLVVQGRFSTPTEIPNAMVQIYDLEKSELFSSIRLRPDGSYFGLVPAGTNYDLSVYPLDNKSTFYSEIIEAKTLEKLGRRNIESSLVALDPGTIQDLNAIRYTQYSSDISEESSIELRRLSLLLQKNPGIRVEIGVHIKELLSDSVQSSPDLTEVIVDSMFQVLAIPPPMVVDTVSSEDSTLVATDSTDTGFDSTTMIIENIPDSVGISGDDNTNIDLPEIDLFQAAQDSIINLGYTEIQRDSIEIKFLKLKYTYHNDRTQNQAQSVVDYMASKGAPPNLFEAKGYGDLWADDKSSAERNYWVEAKILK